MNYLDSLNAEQKKAVLQTEGPVLIVAGAGAGKTKTVTHRILHLIHTGTLPERILAITFTNKAAKEMRERVIALLPGHMRIPFISTFHALGVQVIKENAPLFKLPRYFNIFDTADSKKTLKDALINLGYDPKEHLDKIRHIISHEKGRGASLKEYLERGAHDPSTRGTGHDFTSELVGKAWKKYEETLNREHALDFDDLLLKMLMLFETNKETLERYRDRFTHIHVDEYQDTNKVQNRIVELLAGKYRNLCVVGDTDQNIYSWRGAEIKNMLHFEKTYPEAKTFFLEENYRSTKNILAAANIVIEKNNFRIPKKLFTNNAEGEKISIFEGRNEADEARFIAGKCKDLMEDSVNLEEIAVLYRANFQSRVLEDVFLAHGVPYQMLGTKFFERKEIKDCMSFIKTSLNPQNQKEIRRDFLRILNIPPRGIGKTTVQKIIEGKENELPESMRIKVQNFRGMLSNFKDILLTEKPSEGMRKIIQISGMENMYKTGLEEDTERLENIYELITLATKYDEYETGEGIEKFLTDVALTSDQDALDGEKTGVKLMTVHASKGLEFDYVFISGLEADLFPHTRMNEKKTGEASEEERRLFYVALTRARKKLFLTWAQTRTIFGSLEVNSPSEFLEDIPDEYTEKETFGGKIRVPLFSIAF